MFDFIRKVKQQAAQSFVKNGRRETLADATAHLAAIGFLPKTIIDVGVAYGTPGLYGVFEGAKYLLIEPLVEYEHVLRKLCHDYDGQYFLVAAGRENCRITLNVHPDLSGSSLFYESEGPDVDGEPREVQCVRLDETCAESNLVGPYLIKVDVQGAELDVLDGATAILPETEVIMLEVSLFQLWVESPQLHDVVTNMNEKGFVVYDIFGGHYRPLDNALGQIDLVFVRENGSLRKSHHWATREQRVKLTKHRIEFLNIAIKT